MAKKQGKSDKDELPKVQLNKKNFQSAAPLLRYLLPHKYKFFLGIAFLLLTSATALIFPKLMGGLMGLAGEKNTSATALLQLANEVVIKLLILFGLQAAFSFGRVVLFVNVTENVLKDLRVDAFIQLIRMPMDFFNQRQVSELNSRLSADLSQIQDTFTTNLAEFLRQLIIIIGGVIIICITSIHLALVMLSTIPIIAILTVFFGRKIRQISKNVQDEIANSTVIVGETLQGIASVKTYTNEFFESIRYLKSVSKIKEMAIKGGMARGAFFSFIIFCLFGTIIMVVWYAIHLSVQGLLAPRDLMSFLFYTVFVAASMGGIAEQYAQLQRALGATQRVLEIIQGAPEAIQLEPEKNRFNLKGDIVFENITFSYPSRPNFQVLNGVSFSGRQGETIALVGPSGSGKSTLTQLLLQFYQPSSGNLLIDGKNANNYPLSALRENMAIVPQEVLLFGGTIKENIAYGKTNATFEEIKDAAKKANALEFIESFPDQFETKVGERGIQLSGGQRQRIAIARAVLKNPPILILDEATSSLDSESERLVQEALDKLMHNRTSLVVAHRLSTIRKASRIIVLEKGHVRETGTHAELMQQEDGLYRSLVKLQYE